MATQPIATGTRMSVAEFLDLPDTEERNKMELDYGELYIMPRPRPLRQFLLYWLGWHIANYIQRFVEPPAEVYPDVVVILSRDPRRVLAPDLAIIHADNPYRIIGGYFEGVPDIAVEVLSSDRNRDLTRKRQLYAEAGVPEYWIFDPINDTALLLELRDGDYVSRGLLTADDTVTTPLLPGLDIPLAELFHHRQRPADV